MMILLVGTDIPLPWHYRRTVRWKADWTVEEIRLGSEQSGQSWVQFHVDCEQCNNDYFNRSDASRTPLV